MDNLDLERVWACLEGYNYSPTNKNPVLLGTKQRSRNILRTRVQSRPRSELIIAEA